MKIVIIEREEGLKVGGIVIYNQRLSEYLSSRNHKVDILRFTNKNTGGGNVHPIPYYFAEPRSYIFLPSEKTIRIIRDYLIKLEPDLVYFSIGISPMDFFIPDLCHSLNIPIAGVWHGDINSQPGSLNVLIKSVFLAYLPFCKQLDMLHLFSQKLAFFHTEHGVKKDKIVILPNGVNTGIYRSGPSLFKKKNGIKKGILFLGRLTLVKNPELLIKTFFRLNPPPDTKLVIVGTGDLKKDLMEIYKDPRIIFTGLVENESKKIDIIRSCDIFVLPSKYEGMSLALLEAMSSGLACIASNVGANDDLLQNAGILIRETKMSSELPIALRILLENSEFVRLLGSKAQKKVWTNYSQDKIFASLIRAFIKTIKDYKQKKGLPPNQIREIKIDEVIIRKVKPVFKKLREIGSYFISDQ